MLPPPRRRYAELASSAASVGGVAGLLGDVVCSGLAGIQVWSGCLSVSTLIQARISPARASAGSAI